MRNPSRGLGCSVWLAIFGTLGGCAATVDGSHGTPNATDGAVVDIPVHVTDGGLEDLPVSIRDGSIADVLIMGGDSAPVDAPPSIDVPLPCLVTMTTCGNVTAPRPIAPLSTATTTSQQPTLRWQLAPGSDGAVVQICHDRACTDVEQTIPATGTSVVPGRLASGVHFWRLAGRAEGVTGTAVGPTWEFFVGHRSAPVDTSWGSKLDFNGDGYADLVVGDWLAGEAWLYLSSASGPGTDPIAFPSMTGLGFSASSAGDVNGDGFADVVVGTSHSIEVFLGNPSAVVGAPMSLTVGPQSGNFGWSVAGAGDINGDGYADVVVGAPMSSTVYVFLGSASGLSAAPTSIHGNGVDFGVSVAGAGDVNGDGFGDVVVGAPGNNEIAVFLGSAVGLANTPATLTAPSAGLPGFGNLVDGAGDMNGDGYADLVVGGGNVAYVYVASASGFSTPPMPLTDGNAPNIPLSLANAGDFNGDGFADIMMGSSTNIQELGETVVYGGAILSFGGDGLDAVGNGRGVGDLNGDGYDDVFVGLQASNTGRVFLGAALSPFDALNIPAPAGSARFGTSYARARRPHHFRPQRQPASTTPTLAHAPSCLYTRA